MKKENIKATLIGFCLKYSPDPTTGQVSHGAGATLEGSHNNAAHTALKTLASNGLDTVVENG